MATARTLVLLRHAKSAWPAGVPDHDRPLNPRGRRDAAAVGRWLRETHRVPDLVLCSTARRTRETWQLAERELGAQPPVRFEPEVYEAPPARLLDLVRGLPPEAGTVVVVGHDPGVPGLARALADRGDPAQIPDKFPTAALAVVELTGSWSRLGPGPARLVAFVSPRDLAGDGKQRRR
jgi:phosphohistidine phosphatase